jgi:hypothetical protein
VGVDHFGVLHLEGDGDGGFVGEVVVEGADGGAGLFGDGGHGDGVVAVLADEGGGGGEEGGAAEGGAGLLGLAAGRDCGS